MRSNDGRSYLPQHRFLGKKGAAHPRWRGGRIINNGYALLYRPDRPDADKNGYVAEHRVVWEEANGRRLRPSESVHHINRDRLDNRPENLIARRRGQGARMAGSSEDGR